MLCLPSSLDELLLLFAPCFTKPTFHTFRALVVGQISQTRLRCVTGMLIGARLSEIWHHARAHHIPVRTRIRPSTTFQRASLLIAQDHLVRRRLRHHHQDSRPELCLLQTRRIFEKTTT